LELIALELISLELISLELISLLGASSRKLRAER